MPGEARGVSINSTPWNCDYNERFKSFILPSKLSINALQMTFFSRSDGFAGRACDLFTPLIPSVSDYISDKEYIK